MVQAHDLQRTTTRMSAVPRAAATTKPGFSNFTHALLATALFRCWHIIIFFAAWSTVWTVLTKKHILNVSISSTLLTVIGTVLGFVISYRTTSSFERYNEGRKYWSQIVLAARTFARTTWFHIPELLPPTDKDEGRSEAERMARVMIEKKAAVNLIEAFAVAVKHYLRGEQGVYYDDLYPLVKNLPPYALPAGMATQDRSQHDMSEKDGPSGHTTARASDATSEAEKRKGNGHGGGLLPLPASSPRSPRATSFATPQSPSRNNTLVNGVPPPSLHVEEPYLLPAHDPPKYSLFDLFPFSLLVKMLTNRGKNVKGKKAARLRAKLGRGSSGSVISHNVPLEITLYLSSYIAALQNRKSIDVATTNQLLAALNNLVDALTGLERILTTPIPFSYSVHLWIVTWLYVIALPFQVVSLLGWLTIPATVLASFIFFGFLVAGEEIENPFGYDKNDLNLDHFCHNIIRLELRAITSMPVPDPADWAFSSANDCLFDTGAPVAPEEWVQKGVPAMRDALNSYDIDNS